MQPAVKVEEFDSPIHASAEKKAPPKLVLPSENKKMENGSTSQPALTLQELKSSSPGTTYSPRPKPASFVRTRTEVASESVVLHESPLMQPVTWPSAGSFRTSLEKEKKKSPLAHGVRWRRRSKASLIFLILNIFHGKPLSVLLCSSKSPGALGSRTSNTSSVPFAYWKMIVMLPSSFFL